VRDREIYRRHAGGLLRRPAPALSGRVATARLVRAAASDHAVAETGFLGPATRVASRMCSAAGPRNDRSVFIPQITPNAERLGSRDDTRDAVWIPARGGGGADGPLVHPLENRKEPRRADRAGALAAFAQELALPRSVISKEAPHRSRGRQIAWRRLRNLLSGTARHVAALDCVGLPSASAFRRSGLSVAGSRFLGRAKVRCMGELRAALPRNDSFVPTRVQCEVRHLSFLVGCSTSANLWNPVLSRAV
jgi:hypothetical protein